MKILCNLDEDGHFNVLKLTDRDSIWAMFSDMDGNMGLFDDYVVYYDKEFNADTFDYKSLSDEKWEYFVNYFTDSGFLEILDI